jgi:drug/metabolite transporter (DMT)-like permease
MNQISKAGPIDIGLMLLTALIWASAFVSIKFVLVDLQPFWAAAGRVTVGFFALLPFVVIRKEHFDLTFHKLLNGALVSLLNISIPFLLLFWGLQYVDSGVSSLLMGTTPFMAMIMGHFFTTDEKINRYKLVAVGLAMSGIFMIVGPSATQNFGDSPLIAQLAIIGAAFCYVTGNLFIRKVDMTPVAFTTLTLGLGAVILIVLALAVEGVPTALPRTTALLALLWLGIFPTGLAHVMRFYLVRKVGISTFSIAMNTIPVFGILFGATLLNETIEITTIYALCLVISGLVVARLGALSREKTA